MDQQFVMDESTTIEQFLTHYHLLAVFVGSFFLGESVIATAGYLAAQLGWPVLPVFLAALGGTVVSDTVWFAGGRFAGKRLARSAAFSDRQHRVARWMTRLMGTRPAFALLFTKFLYGSRIAIIIYVAATGLSLAAFTFYNSIGAIVWLVVILGAAYLAGAGMAQVLPFVDAVKAGVAVLILTAVASKVLSIWLSRRARDE